MSNGRYAYRITVTDNTQVVTIVDTFDTYEYTITGNQYVYSMIDTNLYRPSYDFSDRRNSMYIFTLPIF